LYISGEFHFMVAEGSPPAERNAEIHARRRRSLSEYSQ
jgi:hypothetical protein